MGIGSNWAVEVAEEQYREVKEEWIRERLGGDADEDSPGWDELWDAYDELTSGEIEEYDDWSVEGKTRIEIFEETIAITREVLGTKFSPLASKNILVMLHGHVVAAVEAYLSSTFIDITLSSDEYIRKLVENDPELPRENSQLKKFLLKKKRCVMMLASIYRI